MIDNIVALEGINTALITGAGSGIGEAFAIELAKLGLNCVLVDIDKDNLKRVSNSLEKKYNIKTWTIQQDLSVYDASQRVFDYCQEKKIQVGILVNNAGTLIFEELSNVSQERINLILYLHIHCTTFLTYLFGKEMLKRKKGFIINISSICDQMMLPGIHLYGATKSYIRNFTRSIYYEFIRRNVGVTLVRPSGVDTACFKLPKKFRNIALKLGLLVKPEHVAKISIMKAFKFKKEVFPSHFDRLFIFITTHLIDSVIFKIMEKLPQFQEKQE